MSSRWDEGGDVLDPVHLDGLVDAVVDRLPVILTEVREMLEQQHPDYAGFLAGEFDEVLGAARHCVLRLLGGPGADPRRAGMEHALFAQIGRMHHSQGQPVTALLGVYRDGAAIAWSHVAQLAVQGGYPADLLVAVAGNLFNAVEHLAQATLEGYLEEHPSTEQSHARDELHALLLSGRADLPSVQAQASRAGWVLPRTAAIVLVDPDRDGLQRMARSPGQCLTGWHAGAPVSIVADPQGPGHRTRLRTELTGVGAVIGSTVAIEALPATLPLAEHASRLAQAGVLPADPVFVDEHLDTLIVHRDPLALAALRERCLAPLDGLTPPARDRLIDTLRCWLTHMGERAAMADCLHVHPQTVRYRMRKLREVFGPALDDPAHRAALTLVLVWGAPASDLPPDPVVGRDPLGSDVLPGAPL